MFCRIATALTLSLLLAHQAYAAEAPEIVAPAVPTTNAAAPAPEAPPQDKKEVTAKLREHARALYELMMKTPNQERGAIYMQMMTDCGSTMHQLRKNWITLKIADQREKKMAKILADGQLSAKEIGEWNKVFSGQADPAK